MITDRALTWTGKRNEKLIIAAYSGG